MMKFVRLFVMKTPASLAKIKSLSKTLTLVNEIKSLELLGSSEKINWEQTGDALQIHLPQNLPSPYALGFKIELDDKSRQMWELVIE